jgi:hypothetical protein
VRRFGPGGEIGDHRLVESIADIGTIQRHVFDGAAAFNFQELIAHLRAIDYIGPPCHAWNCWGHLELILQ